MARCWQRQACFWGCALAVPGLRSGTLFSEWSAASQHGAAPAPVRIQAGCAAGRAFSDFSAAPEQTPCLTITMEQPTALYLRGFTGDTFTGTAWQALDAQTLAEQTDLLYWLHKEGLLPADAACRRVARPAPAGADADSPD